MPVRLTVGNKTPEGQVEWKERGSEEITIISLDEAISRLR
jgi:anticodon tRNA-binding protein